MHNLKLLSLFLVITLTAFIVSCSSDNAPPTSSWQQYQDQPGGLQKSVVKLITVDLGGVVGGLETFGNYVTIPPGALPMDTYINVKALPLRSDVFFGPTMYFRKSVTITLSYRNFPDISTHRAIRMKIYWYDPEKLNWVLFNDKPIVDTELKTFTFETNHFSRYAWGD